MLRDRRRNMSRSDPSTAVFAEIDGPESGDESAASRGTSSTGFDFGTDGPRPPNDTGEPEGSGRAHFSAVAPAHQMSSTTDKATQGAIASTWTERRLWRVVIES